MQWGQALRRPLAVEEVLPGELVAVLGEPGGQVAVTGQVAPPLTLPDVDGNAVTLTGTGRKTAVVAWSTWWASICHGRGRSRCFRRPSSGWRRPAFAIS